MKLYHIGFTNWTVISLRGSVRSDGSVLMRVTKTNPVRNIPLVYLTNATL